MKKQYMKPQTEVVRIQQQTQLMAGSGDDVYGDPASGGSQLSRQNGWWDEDEEE